MAIATTAKQQEDEEGASAAWEILHEKDIDNLEERMRSISREGRVARPESPVLMELVRGRYVQRRNRIIDDYLKSCSEWREAHAAVRWSDVLFNREPLWKARKAIDNTEYWQRRILDDFNDSSGIVPSGLKELAPLLSIAPSHNIYERWKEEIQSRIVLGGSAALVVYGLLSSVIGKSM